MPFKNPDPLYTVWQSMRRRCLTPTSKQFADYGGRGITICRAWDSFEQFKADMGPRPSGTSLDRKNNDGDYEPSNCRWATRKQQQRNRRIAVYVTIEGERYRAIELAESSGLKPDTIVKRAAMGMAYSQVIAKTRYAGGRWQKAVAVRVAKQRAKTRCKHGHEYTPENTGINKQGSRFCRHCHRLKTSRQSERKRALRRAAKFASEGID